MLDLTGISNAKFEQVRKLQNKAVRLIETKIVNGHKVTVFSPGIAENARLVFKRTNTRIAVTHTPEIMNVTGRDSDVDNVVNTTKDGN